MASSVYAVSMVDVLDATALNLSLVDAGNRIALFTNALVPNFLTDSDFTAAPYNANQVAASGTYATGGQLLAGQTFIAAGASPVITYDATNSGWTGVTFTARYGIFYADAIATNSVYYCLDFGADFTATTGPFDILYHAAGIFTWTL